MAPIKLESASPASGKVWLKNVEIVVTGSPLPLGCGVAESSSNEPDPLGSVSVGGGDDAALIADVVVVSAADVDVVDNDVVVLENAGVAMVITRLVKPCVGAGVPGSTGLVVGNPTGPIVLGSQVVMVKH